jgi:lipopolysaccharide transport system ATP-binding protein
MHVIEAHNISKRYRIQGAFTHNPRSLREVISRNLKHRLYSASPFYTPHLEMRDYWALKDISFAIPAGEKVALIGKNGSGKTTLLRILSQITMPTSGSVNIQGKLSSLLQAGTGFHPELSGRENVFMNGIVLGMSKQEVKNKFDEIVAFSGIEEFIDMPIKYYSTGMQGRLGFSVAAHLHSEIMLIDEGLASGDSEFRQKCILKIRELSSQGRTILFVSHDPQIVKSICSRELVLEKGVLVNDTKDVQSLTL